MYPFLMWISSTERKKATLAMWTCFNQSTCFMRAIHLLFMCLTFQQKHSCFGQSKEPVRHCKFASPSKLAALSSVMAIYVFFATKWDKTFYFIFKDIVNPVWDSYTALLCRTLFPRVQSLMKWAVVKSKWNALSWNKLSFRGSHDVEKIFVQILL